MRIRLRKRFRIAVIVAALLAGGGTAAWAAYPVIDTTAIGKLTEQLSMLQKHLDKLGEVSAWAQKTVDAVGKFGQISLPMINIDRLSNQLRRDADCLMTDLSKLMPGVRFEDLNYRSICSIKNAYRQTLWLDPDGVFGDGADDGGQGESVSWEDQAAARKAIEERRETLMKTVATDGLAQADVATQEAAETADAGTKELQNAAAAATDVNGRLAVMIQAQVQQNRLAAQQNQLLAQLLKVQSSMLMAMTVPVDSRALEDER